MAITCLFPLAPALDAVATIAEVEHDARVQRLSFRLGVHPRTVLKWQEAGGVDVWTADRIATAVGRNAEALWPGWETTADHMADAVPTQYDLFADVS